MMEVCIYRMCKCGKDAEGKGVVTGIHEAGHHQV